MPPFTLAWCLGGAPAAHLSLQLRAAKGHENLTEVPVSPGLKHVMLNFTPFLLTTAPTLAVFSHMVFLSTLCASASQP